MRTIACAAMAVLLGILSISSVLAAEQAYVFTSFRGNGDDGLHLAYSHDGLTWTALKNDASFLRPEIGGKLMRDPCIVQGPDGMFHMVWTTGWWENNIGVAHSRDLIEWSEQTALPVMAHEPEVLNSWAPEIFYDPRDEEYLIFWASTIPGKFDETEERGDIQSSSGKGLNHRMYYVKTKDFKTYSETALFYDPAFVCIDATLLQDGKRTIMFIKDETKRPEPEKNIRIAIAADPEGPYGPASPPFTPEGVWLEGATSIKIGDYFYVYYDAYTSHRMMAARSKDLIHWEDISDQVRFPRGTRHGTVLAVDKSVVDNLLAAESSN